MIIFTMNIERDWEIPDAHRIEILAHFDASMPEYENEAFNTLLEDQAGHLPEKPFLIAKVYGTLFPIRPAATPAELCLELIKAGRPGQGLNENAEYFVNIRDAAAFMRDNPSVAALLSGIDKVARGFSIQQVDVNKGVSEAGILPHMLAELDLLAGPSNGLFFVTPVQKVDIGQSRLLDAQAQVLSFSNIFYAKHRPEGEKLVSPDGTSEPYVLNLVMGTLGGEKLVIPDIADAPSIIDPEVLISEMIGPSARVLDDHPGPQ